MNESVDEIDSQGDSEPEDSKRPIALSIICVMGFVGGLFSLAILVFFPQALSVGSSTGSWYFPYFAITLIVGLACFIGIWRMKKVSAYAYIGMVVLNQPIMLVIGTWDLKSLIIPGITAAIILRYIRKMN